MTRRHHFTLERLQAATVNVGQITASSEVLEYVSGTDLVIFDTLSHETHLLEAPTSLIYQIIRDKTPVSEEQVKANCEEAGIAISEVALESALENLSKVKLIWRIT